WEWVIDCYKDNYANARSDGTAASDVTAGCLRVVRGGSLDSSPWFLRSASRDGVAPGFRFNHFGFRLARTLDEAEAKRGAEGRTQTESKKDERFAVADVIAHASRRIESGDVVGAREFLAAALAAADYYNVALISFALA